MECNCLNCLVTKVFFRQTTDYRRSICDHRDSPMMKGGHGQTIDIHWDALDRPCISCAQISHGTTTCMLESVGV